ncbi:hypothetical protein CYMTET_48272, partial [Cymbomonas tetramitiformis]
IVNALDAAKHLWHPGSQCEPEFKERLVEFVKGTGTGSLRFDNGTEVVQMQIGFKSPLVWHEAPQVLRDEYSFWRDWLQERLARAPRGLQDGFVTTSWFRYAETYKALMESATWSLSLSLALAWLVLLLSTGSVILSMLSTLCIACVVIDFMGFMVIAGWGLGIIESVCITVLVGLSVDYIVHIANGYVQGSSQNRHTRVRQAGRHMGMSVLCGAVTTIGGALFLKGCTIVFFDRFGTFVAITLTTALLHALLLFPALCAICAPQDTSVHIMIRGWRGLVKLHSWMARYLNSERI